MSMKDFASAVMEIVNVAIEQSSPDQREAWIRDQVINGFKGTSMEGYEESFLNKTNDPAELSIIETARTSPSSLKSMIIVVNEKIKATKAPSLK